MSDPGDPEGHWAELMRAAQKGDTVAYRQLLTEIVPAIRRTVVRRRSRTDEADDVVQEVLLSIHSVRHTYDPERPFLPWLMTIVRYRVADLARVQIRRAANEVTVATFPETFPDAPTNIHEGFGDAETLRQAIVALPSGQRQAVELLKLREMSLKEASAVSGQGVSALKVAMHRALKALRSALGGERER